MPPRIQAHLGLRSLTLCLRPKLGLQTAPLQPWNQTANISQREKRRRMKQDPYGWAQAQQRKAANMRRRGELQQGRDVQWGDPIHGITTPFVESFDSAGQAPLSQAPASGEAEPHPLPTSPNLLNFSLTKEELDDAVAQAYVLSRPVDGSDPVANEEERARHEQRHANATEALQRLTTLEQSSSKDRLRVNIRRCVDTFGRHTTDATLERPKRPLAKGVADDPAPSRAGPDTGSSEVQIAILTAKIRVCAARLAQPRGKRDKAMRRGLRTLVHKRQKLLRYMERRERGSGRWQHMIETLGLSPATWKKQITF